MRTTLLAALAATLLAACADDVWTIPLPPITTTGVDTTAAESDGCILPFCACPAAYNCVVLGDLAACEKPCHECPDEKDHLACDDFAGCSALGEFTKCECNAGACAAGGPGLGELPCYASCDVCGVCP